jgi:hypothetical protein
MATQIILILYEWFFSAKWWQVYNLVEYLVQLQENNNFLQRLSCFLEREKSGCRVVAGQLVAITDASELGAVEDARFAGTRHQRC